MAVTLRSSRVLAGALAMVLGGALMMVGGESVASATPAASSASAAQPAANGANGKDDVKKVFVCKYVGKPGVDERLQTGDNPINTSVNSIPEYDGVGSYFADAHGRSYVLAEDHGQAEPDVSECPPPDNGPTEISVSTAPSVTAATCDAAGTLQIPTQDHVTFSGGTDGDGPGTYTITATAADGYKLTGTTSWTLTVDPKVTGDSCQPIPATVTPVEPTVTLSTQCDVDDVLSVVDGQQETGYHYEVNQKAGDQVEVKARADAGYVFDNGKTVRQWTFTVRTVANGGINKCVEPVEPTVKVSTECGVADQLIVPADTDAVKYEVYQKPDNQVEVKARAQAGYEFTNGKTLRQWTLTVNPATDCAVETTPADPTVTLSTECNVDDVLTVPADTDAVSYVEKWNDDKTHVQVVAHAADGYYFNTNGEHKTIRTWEFDVRTVANGGIEVCGEPITTVVTSPASPTTTSSRSSQVTSPSKSTEHKTTSAAPSSSATRSSTTGEVVVATTEQGEVAATTKLVVATTQAAVVAAVAPVAGPPAATAKTGETAGSTAYLLFAGGLLLLLSGLWSRRRGDHAA